MIKEVFETGSSIPERSKLGILCSLVEEVGELSTEVSISEGLSYKTEGPDGVIGEAVDVLICALDIIKVHKPEITEEEIIKLVQDKCAKWKRKSLEVK
jgi:NTP pyrophosphatase (non-canonical NTP hydrolase)